MLSYWMLDKWPMQAPLSPTSEETANKLLILGVSGLSPMTVRQSPSSPSLNNTVWKGGIDLWIPPNVHTIPSSRAPDDIDEMRSDPALLEETCHSPFQTCSSIGSPLILLHYLLC